MICSSGGISWLIGGLDSDWIPENERMVTLGVPREGPKPLNAPCKPPVNNNNNYNHRAPGPQPQLAASFCDNSNKNDYSHG